MFLYEDNSDGFLDMNWSDFEGDGISSNCECDSFLDEELESVVCVDDFS